MNTNEETIVMGADGIDLTSDQFKQPQQDPQSPIVKPITKPAQTTNNNQTWKRVAIGGAAGIMIGTAGAAAATVAYHHFFDNDEETAENENAENAETANTENGEHAYRTLDNGMKVAENIDESLSFKDAFNAAREQVGPDGVFHWHGNVYSTHTEAEWNSMTPQERSEFVHNATPEYSNAAAEQPVHEQAHAAQAHHTATHHEATAHTARHEVEDNEDVAVHTNDSGDDDVQIVGVEEVTLADGSVATMATTHVDGHEVYMVDVDHDGVFDVAAMDANANGQLEEGELMDISQHNIHVASVNNTRPTTSQPVNTDENTPGPDMGGDPDEITVDPNMTADTNSTVFDATTTAYEDTAMQDYNNDVSGDLLV